ncbi:MAG: YhcH/YjgK/YiaL family protein [Candidatus Gastranaerophilales bacterium]|nr:YhcH/YjgK/YiaL family protein [Candidatus Gastranaerophilales bacterium]
MIIDVLSESDKYILLNKEFKFVFDYIKQNDLKNMECGIHELKGKEIYFNLQEYKTKPIQKLEAHKKYIDIQVVITGEEYMGYTNISNTSIIEEYNEEKDVMFLSGTPDKIKTDNKSFLIFYPEDAHMPALSIKEPQNVKKAIFKILIK